MPKYPLSSNLLALLSGSFYGTAGPYKKGRHDVRLDEGSKQEETKKTRKSPKRRRTRRNEKEEAGEGKAEVEYQNGGVPRDKISLCALTGAHRGLGQRIPSSRSHISRIPLSYFTARPLPRSSHLSTSPRSIRGPERVLNFLLSRFFRSPISSRPFQSTTPLRR